MSRSVWIVLVAACLAGCRQPKELVYKDVQEITLNHVNLQKGSLSLKVRLYNPNRYSLKIKHSDIEVFLNNNSIGIIDIPGGTTITRLDTSAIPVTLAFDVKQALPDFIQSVLGNDIYLQMNGSVRAGRHGIFIKVPVHYEGNVQPF